MTQRRAPKVLVGCCGFAEAQARYFRDFPILEVQKSFYQPPRVSTAERWRHDAGREFMFTLKAWQLITHESSSPTYRRLREPLSERDKSRVGSFRLNEVTRRAWERTQDVADALQADAIVLQMPKRFVPSTENLRRLRRFIEAVDRRGRRIAFEPRGKDWTPEVLRPLLRDLELVHAADPFVDAPVGRGLRYFRLHGWPPYRYGYRYTDGDLDQLSRRLTGPWPFWILFNNDSMADDARRLMARLSDDA
jgi:uncharacterized protein YecE (DUF72 family)